jgi:hypothetical protein
LACGTELANGPFLLSILCMASENHIMVRRPAASGARTQVVFTLPSCTTKNTVDAKGWSGDASPGTVHVDVLHFCITSLACITNIITNNSTDGVLQLQSACTAVYNVQVATGELIEKNWSARSL